MTNLAPETEFWIRGFLTGAEPQPPDEEDELPEFRDSLAEFHRRGVWPPPGWKSSGPPEDAEIAARRGLTFEVATKTQHGAPWVSKVQGVQDLLEALRLARESEGWEVTVFVHRAGIRDGFPYWTSRNPESFGSSVLHGIVRPGIEQEIAEREDFGDLAADFITDRAFHLALRALLARPPSTLHRIDELDEKASDPRLASKLMPVYVMWTQCPDSDDPDYIFLFFSQIDLLLTSMALVHRVRILAYADILIP